MRYFKAFEIAEKPLIQWDCFANSKEEYDELQLAKDPTVLIEKDIPDYVFGVCPLKIDNGVLVNRTPAEMGVFEAQHNIKEKVNNQKRLVDVVNNSSFDFEGKSFPLNEAARIYYSAIKELNGDLEVMTVTGENHFLTVADFEGFFSAMNTRLKALLTPSA